MMVRWIAHLAVAAGLLVCVLVGSARADGSPGAEPGAGALTLALIDIEVVGNVGPELRSELGAAIMRALGDLGVRAVDLEDVRKSLRSRPDLAGCVTPACVRALPELLGTNRYLRLWLEARGAAYSLELSLLGGEEGGVLQRQQAECPVCTTMELMEKVREATLVLAKAARGVPVFIASEPEGARLRIDGRDVGASPFAGYLSTGTHQVEATLDGFARAESTIEVVAAGEEAEPQRFGIALTADLSPTPVVSRPRGRPFRVLKWVGAAAAWGALGAGVTWVAVDGKGTCAGPGECPEVYDTGTVGLVGLGVGVALGATAGWMFWRDSQDARATARVSPTAGGAMGSVLVRF